MCSLRSLKCSLALTTLVAGANPVQAETFRVATYNVESYVDEAVAGRAVKSAEARAKVRESILALKPDVLALEEMGSVNALEELRASLKTNGLDFPFWEMAN